MTLNKARFCFVITILFFSNIISIIPMGGSVVQNEPMREVRPGWDILRIYEIQHPPGPKCIGENNDLYYVDNLNHVMMKMDEFGIHTEYRTLNISLSDIVYQPIHNRYIGVDGFCFYTITSSEFNLLNNYSSGGYLSTLTVDPTDDSFYSGSLTNGTDILKFDADGNFITTILSNVQGCSQIVLNNEQSILYYTETYLGSFSMMNLTSSMTTVLKTGVGLPGTQEVIGIGVDDNDDLYYMTADGNNRGFYKYNNTDFVFLMASKVGMSTLTWSTKMQTFIAAGSFGGCLISYDPDKTEAEILTPLINSQSIIETNDGMILYVIDDTIYKINQTGPTYFGRNPYNKTISKLIVDADNNIYALLGNDSVTILRVHHDGSFEDWFIHEFHEWAKSIHYDVKNNEIILLTEDILKNETYVYRIPISNPMDYHKIDTFEKTTKIVGVTDTNGNIFLYEAYNNTLYKIPEGSMEREIITTDFVDFSDIYGGDVIVEPTLCYSTIENGILIGRNDDLQMWLLDEHIRITFAINNRGIDNSALFENSKKEIICTQSTLVLKFIYHKPENPTISSLIYFPIIIAFFSMILIMFIKKRRIKVVKNRF
ncbi:MAG: hypothetical protein EAX91_08690 [Candidatus Lokiarchaeota archaeon]|nr:hypothetical protein [Candidatus Lokiarchaeota archaeon]